MALSVFDDKTREPQKGEVTEVPGKQ